MKSIIERTSEECFVCKNRGYLERHHVFGGANRKLSEKYGLTVHLCWGHHQDSKIGVHYDSLLMRRMHEEGQRAFEKTHSREDFRKIFGKNYLDEEIEKGSRKQEPEWGVIFLPSTEEDM